MKIWCFQHFEPEEAGLIATWAGENGHPVETVHLYRGDALPKLAPEDALVLMGGPMNVDQEEAHQWLAPEKALIAQHIAAGGRVFGVCLGGQLIARAMGAIVKKNAYKEIGWWPVNFTEAALADGPFAGFDSSITVLQWHGDTFDIPQGAVPLASSPVCASQAFSYNGGRVIGLQFHFEAEEKEVHDFVSFFSEELAQGGPYVQEPQDILHGLVANAQPCKDALYKVLDVWAKA